MITEDLVSFEVAKLLKEKGFDEICRKFYKCWPTNPKLYCCDKSQMFDYCTNSSLSGFNYVGDEMNVAAPTHQMVMKWLREVYGIFIAINNDDLDFNWQCYDLINRGSTLDPKILSESYAGYKAYEEAVEAALKYCLEEMI